MTPNEFKAWFDGFIEAFDGKIPTSKQWTRIKERVAEIDGRAITERVFVDRWWPYVHHHYPPWYTTTGFCIPNSGGGSLQAAQQNQNVLNDGHVVQNNAFDGHVAMYALGKADAAALSAA